MDLETLAVCAIRTLASFTPSEASAIFPATAFVTDDCSSMAAAMLTMIAPTSLITPEIFSIPPIALSVDACTPAILSLMFSVAWAVCRA